MVGIGFKVPSIAVRSGGSLRGAYGRVLRAEVRARRERVGRRVAGKASRDAVKRAAVEAARDRAAQHACEHLSALMFAVPVADLRADRRGGPRTARARQTAMYLAHVIFSVPQAGVGRLFDRDRTNVMFACARVEDGRDDADTDRMLEAMEAMLVELREDLLEVAS